MKQVKELDVLQVVSVRASGSEQIPVRLKVRSGNRYHTLNVVATYDHDRAEITDVTMVDGRRFAELDEDGRGAFGLGHFSVEEVYRAVAAALV